ncbi:MAG: hypothetical protein KDD64_06575 [Bdellovibrionales bacterium]|nr:hypothetical protein [Bdellovibrionales bacterium]
MNQVPNLKFQEMLEALHRAEVLIDEECPSQALEILNGLSNEPDVTSAEIWQIRQGLLLLKALSYQKLFDYEQSLAHLNSLLELNPQFELAIQLRTVFEEAMRRENDLEPPLPPFLTYAFCAQKSETYAIGKNGYRRIYHVHIRKTAGRAINSAFYALGGEDPVSVADRAANQKKGIGRALSGEYIYHPHPTVTEIKKGDYFYAHSHRPLHTLTFPTKTFTFSSFRDPLSRAISYFRMLHDIPDDAREDLLEEKEAMRHGFKEFVARVDPTHLLAQLYMFSPNFDVEEAFENVQKLSLFMFQDRMSEGIGLLREHLEIPLNIPELVGASKSPFHPSQEEKQLLCSALEPEYQLMKRLESLYGERFSRSI